MNPEEFGAKASKFVTDPEYRAHSLKRVAVYYHGPMLFYFRLILGFAGIFSLVVFGVMIVELLGEQIHAAAAAAAAAAVPAKGKAAAATAAAASAAAANQGWSVASALSTVSLDIHSPIVQ